MSGKGRARKRIDRGGHLSDVPDNYLTRSWPRYPLPGRIFFITNIVKCRPPGNRDPHSDEVIACWPYLEEQIKILHPRVIVTLGAPAAKTLLDTNSGIGRLRGRFHDYHGIPLLPTYHPAYLLRSYTLENRKKVWEDMKMVREFIEG